MIDFVTLAAAIELRGVVFLQGDTGFLQGAIGILKCTRVRCDLYTYSVLSIREDERNERWYKFDDIKYTLSIFEDQGAAQAMWELAND